MYVYRLEQLQFNDGTKLDPGKLTIICGPNNVGKSQLLKDIVLLATAHNTARCIVVGAAQFSFPEKLNELTEAYYVERYLDENGNWSYRSLAPDLCSEYRQTGAQWPDGFRKMIEQRNDNSERSFASSFGQAMVAHLTTEHRLQLVKQSPSASDEHEVANLLQMLYASGQKKEKLIRDEVQRAFGCQIALDFSAPQTLLLRVGDDFSKIPADPREAKPILQKFDKLDQQGDGLRAFVGVVVSALVVHRGVFLIDEPEAFLHPPQAFRIGEFLASRANPSTQFVIATHSVDFLRGVLSKTQDVTVVRLDRTANQNTYRQLEPSTLENLAIDPLLSSARVLDGLFYAGAIVVEADRDARFYQAAFKKRFPGIDLNFVNADNKQTVPKIVKLYRDLGVKACGIVDFDVLNEAREFEAALRTLTVSDADCRSALDIRKTIGAEAKEIPPAERLHAVADKVDSLYGEIRAQREDSDQLADFLGSLEGKCRNIAESAKGWRELKQKGIDALSASARKRFDELYNLCAKYGLLVTPTGELESMLVDYGIDRTTDKRAWISRALKLIAGLEPDDSKYPWKFVRSVNENLKIETEAPAPQAE